MALRVNGPLEEDDFVAAWPKVEAFISDALARDGWKVDLEDFVTQASDGLLGLYVVEDDETGEILSAAACEVQEYPHAQVFNIAYCGGRDLYRWAELIGQLEAEAVRFGCQIVRITGRAGWGRVFPEYRETNRVFERRVVIEQ